MAALLSALATAAPFQDDGPWPGPHDVGDAAGARALAEARATWTDRAGWQARAARLRAHLAATLHLSPFPDAGEVGVEVTGRRNLDGYSVANVRFETLPGLFVHANVYEPAEGDGPRPLVLRSHGHFRGTDTDPEGRFQGDVQRLAGVLARAGAVVITWDMMGWGESHQVTHRRPETTALQTFNTMRLLDAALATLDVDPNRIAMTGSSGGGTQTFLATALDPRIDVCAPVVMVSAHFFGGCKCESGLPVHDVPAGDAGPRLRTSNVE
ncbi:MAG: acetylxylan esterase, partial [Planctomycetota bacterium]